MQDVAHIGRDVVIFGYATNKDSLYNKGWNVIDIKLSEVYKHVDVTFLAF